ncbi:oligoendopeptidase F [Candidatus Falkowbacteria bacterium]|nr:oligoendopeptidase F [Candidatus Falkowbacteria bacterium]
MKKKTTRTTWDLSLIYPTQADYQKAFASIDQLVKKLKTFEGKLHVASQLVLFLKVYEQFNITLENVYNYAHLSFDLDMNNPKLQAQYSAVNDIYSKSVSQLTFIDQELSTLGNKEIKALIVQEPRLADKEFFLQSFGRSKLYLHDQKTESILAAYGPVFGASGQLHTVIHDTDFVFESFTYKGKKYPVNDATVSSYYQHKDQKVRELAFKHYYKPYIQFKNTFAKLYDTRVRHNVTTARTRGYADALTMCTFPDYITPSIYKTLLEVVRSNTHLITKLNKIRKKNLKVSKLHFYDNYANFVAHRESKISYEQCVKDFRKSISLLGDEYTKAFESEIAQGVVDVYPRKGKKSGGYHNTGYESGRYIFLNHTDDMQSAYTFAHEWGHALHSYFSNHTQNYYNAQYPIFLAEIASTLNEILLTHHLLKQSKSKSEILYHTSFRASRIQQTLFRQTMFADFELRAHQAVEKGEALTATYLDTLYTQLLTQYLGQGIEIDEELKTEWARIPHFYSPFYVYKYATSLCAAYAFAKKIINKEPGAVQGYLKFLSAGMHKEPLAILKEAGIDMNKTETYEAAMEEFEELLKSF